MTTFEELVEKLKTFNKERDWDQFHNPKDILLALVSEVGELAECYRWLSPHEVNELNLDDNKKKKIEEEVADIFIYLMILCYKSDIDLLEVTTAKLEKNRKKYPIEKSKGIHSNPIQGFKGKETN